MKSYTDLEQSKKLAEILPLESADMYYPNRADININLAVPIEFKRGLGLLSQEDYAWSLAALLGIIRKTTGYTIHGVNNVYMSCELADFKKIETEVYDNEFDACYEMILELHKLNLL